MRNFKNLEIWQISIEICESIYQLCSSIPISEKYNLISQMKRAAISISSNIAEGASRESNKEFKRFLEITIGSAFELETQLILCTRLEYFQTKNLDNIFELLNKVQRKTNALIQKLR
ncbi:MAG: four helix bundle protein [Saprospiraceae bacterium]